MSSSYGPLAFWYDKLTFDVPYESFFDFYEKLFAENGGDFTSVLDLCCGTGTMTWLLAQHGHDVVAVDASGDMLMQAAEKAVEVKFPPLFACQQAQELDLYGTVDAAVCSLDGIDYIPPEDLPEVFRRLHLFIRPQGLFVFDIRTPQWFESIDGEVFVDETEDMLCLWRADFDFDEQTMYYGMDIFSREKRLWRRDSEEHIEYAHSPQWLKSALENAGFANVKLCTDCPQGDDGRMFIVAENLPH